VVSSGPISNWSALTVLAGSDRASVMGPVALVSSRSIVVGATRLIVEP